jgi:hypothetical protein
MFVRSFVVRNPGVCKRLTAFFLIDQKSEEFGIHVGFEYVFVPIHEGKEDKIGHYKLAFLNIADKVVGLYDPLYDANTTMSQKNETLLKVNINQHTDLLRVRQKPGEQQNVMELTWYRGFELPCKVLCPRLSDKTLQCQTLMRPVGEWAPKWIVQVAVHWSSHSWSAN